ncbi:MAG: hypothetical protein JSY10_05905 [Paenibacillus sp.]|nr:hypothetical protein [Paenibacillus sp.]
MMEKTIEIFTEEDEEDCDSNVKLTSCFYASGNESLKKGKRKLEETHQNDLS